MKTAHKMLSNMFATHTSRISGNHWEQYIIAMTRWQTKIPSSKISLLMKPNNSHVVKEL